jgi:fatty acid CoA ligase FadD21
MPQPTLLSILRERASLQPNDTAFTYTDYEQDWVGVADSVTWSQMYRRTLNVAREVSLHGAVGDRALILAPQGLDYIVAFLGAIQAGLIAVPLSVPQVGSHDERVSAVLADTSPSVILTTSAVSGGVTEYVAESNVDARPTVIEVDALDLDARNGPGPRLARSSIEPSTTMYLQYTSGSTRVPAGVIISDRNLTANFEQMMAGYFPDFNGVPPPDTTVVTWLPFYHDMGLMIGVIAPIMGGYRAQIMSPMAFLQRPARWIQALATNTGACSAAPNFAFDLAVRKTTNEDMAGLDLSGVMSIVSGSERVHQATLNRFVYRFARFGFGEHMMTPAYGMAEATVYVATRATSGAPRVVDFETAGLSAGTANRSTAETGSPLISYGVTTSPMVRIVDPDTSTECPAADVGEIWVNGDNVAAGYWNKPDETQGTFGATIVNPSAGTPDGPWLRSGDLGFIYEGELFIVGRIKDLLIVYGRNHYAEDIEATIQEITGGRVAAISVHVEQTEKLVTIIELKQRGDTDEEAMQKLRVVRNDVTSAISKSHGLSVADLVLVGPGTIPTTTSGKIRRAVCVEQYRREQFTRLDA